MTKLTNYQLYLDPQKIRSKINSKSKTHHLLLLTNIVDLSDDVPPTPHCAFPAKVTFDYGDAPYIK